MARLNVMKLIESGKKKINRRYTLDLKNITDIEENSNNIFDMQYNFFVIGYIQGMKAAKAELRYGGNK